MSHQKYFMSSLKQVLLSLPGLLLILMQVLLSLPVFLLILVFAGGARQAQAAQLDVDASGLVYTINGNDYTRTDFPEAALMLVFGSTDSASCTQMVLRADAYRSSGGSLKPIFIDYDMLDEGFADFAAAYPNIAMIQDEDYEAFMWYCVRRGITSGCVNLPVTLLVDNSGKVVFGTQGAAWDQLYPKLQELCPGGQDTGNRNFYSPETGATTLRPITYTVTNGQTAARSMLGIINSFRTGSGAWYWNQDNKTKTNLSGTLSSLQYDYSMERIAQQRAVEIAAFYSHTRPDGSGCFTIGYNGRYSSGENICVGSGFSVDSAQEAFDLWREENQSYEGQGHRRNMLDASFTGVGIGHVYQNGVHYWVQEFCCDSLDTVSTPANDQDTTHTVYIAPSLEGTKQMKAVVDSFNDYPEYGHYFTLEIPFGQEELLPDVALFMSNRGFSYASLQIAPTEDLVWSSSDPAKLEVAKDGSYAKGLAVGDASIIISADGAEKTFRAKVQPVSIGEARISDIAAQDYTGSPLKPAYTVTMDGKTLVKNVDYTEKWSSNTEAGTGFLYISGKGNYEGSASKKFTILPMKSMKKGFTFQDEKGYQYKVTKKGGSGKACVQLLKVPKKVVNVTIPDTVTYQNIRCKVTSIGAKAMKGNKKARRLEIGKNVASIGAQAFLGCKKLQKIIITGTKLKSAKVGSKAFGSLSSKVKFYLPAKKIKAYKKLLRAKGAPKKAFYGTL